jgi:uncharacterized repeat protein (TIGR01451 family)
MAKLRPALRYLPLLSLFAVSTLFGLASCSSEPTEPEPDRADLSITKSDAADPVTVGDEVVYTITVSNAGPQNATGVIVTDDLPSTATFGSANASQGSCSRSGGTVTCDLGSLATGANTTITLTVTADQVGTLTNTATVSGDQEDPNGGNDSATEETTILGAPADLSITKFAQADNVALGSEIVYTITVLNSGPSDATDVEVTDPIPPSTSFVSAEASPGSCAESGGTVTCELGDLADGRRATITLTVLANEVGVVENTATVSSNQPDPDESDNSDTETTAVAEVSSDLSITKASETDPVASGDTIVYTIIARNRGPNEASVVTVIDTVPASTSYVSASSTRGECSVQNGVVICDVGPLPVIFTATVTLRVQANELGDVINTAVVTGSVQDTAQGNNTATDTTTVKPLADLSVDKDDSADPVEVGDELVYTIDVVNLGPNEATRTTVKDTLPDGVDFDDVATTSGDCDESRDIVTCDLGTLDADDSVRITITTIAEQVGFLSNRVSVSSNVEDPDLDNNRDQTGTNVTGLEADLSITKTADADPVTVGDFIVYTINVLNDGPEDVSDFTVTDPVPAGTSFVGATVSPGSCGEGSGVVTCDIPTLPSGVGTTIELTLQADEAGEVTNTATVNPPPNVEDPDESNNEASETVTVNSP